MAIANLVSSNVCSVLCSHQYNPCSFASQSQLAHGREIRHVCKRPGEMNGLQHTEQLRHETPQMPRLLFHHPNQTHICFCSEVAATSCPSTYVAGKRTGHPTGHHANGTSRAPTVLSAALQTLYEHSTTNQSKMCQPRQQTGIPLSPTSVCF